MISTDIVLIPKVIPNIVSWNTLQKVILYNLNITVIGMQNKAIKNYVLVIKMFSFANG